MTYLSVKLGHWNAFQLVHLNISIRERKKKCRDETSAVDRFGFICIHKGFHFYFSFRYVKHVALSNCCHFQIEINLNRKGVLFAVVSGNL